MADEAPKAAKIAMDPVGALFTGAWRRYGERFWTLVWIFFIPSILLLLGRLFLEGGTPPRILVGGILSLIGSLVSIPASLALVNALAHGTDFTMSYRVGLKLFWPAVWICILDALAVVGGFALLIVPGIILSVALMFANYTLVVEDKRGMHALMQSRGYVKGYWWAILGRGILLGAIFLGVLLLVYLPLALLLGKTIGNVIYLVLLLCFTAFGVCYSYEMYANLRRLKAGAMEEAVKGKNGFLKVCMAVGVLVVLVILFLVVIGVLWTGVPQSSNVIKS
ncbi:MAG: hypothetical protein ABSC29_03030 [Minisyncoccia bacterium]|jgi:hypothetical protein